MIVKVHLTALFHNGEYREVEVPEHVLKVNHVGPGAHQGEIDFILEAVFHCGQNEFHPQEKPSVSMGDVAELWGKYWLCCSVGWRELTEHEWLDYLGMSLIDRMSYCWESEVAQEAHFDAGDAMPGGV